jgi:hypothetical protein
MAVPLARRLVAECLGTAFLLAAVVGSGIMAAKLAGGDGTLALLCNTLPTGAILTVLILTFAPISRRAFQSGSQYRVRDTRRKLVLSQSNVRRTKAGVSIEELAEDITRRSLLQSLNVRPVLDAD